MATYKIKWGDTLFDIANKYGTTVDELANINKIKNPNLIYAGNTLEIPGGDNNSSPYKNVNEQSFLPKAEKKPIDYENSPELSLVKNNLETAEKQKPAQYENKYEDIISSLYNNFINSGNAPYSLKGDPLYHQYRDIYLNDAKNASEQAMASALSFSGGLSSSFAQSAANQAYSENIKKLTDNIPEFYKAAQNKKESDLSLLLSQISKSQDLEKGEYNKWRDGIDDYYTDLNYYYSKYNNLSKSDYNKYLDNIELWLKDREYYYKKLIDAQKQKNTENDLEYKWAKI